MNPSPTTPGFTDKEFRLARLITRFLQKKITHAEHLELDEWVGASEENIRTFEALIDNYFLEALHRHPALVEALGHYHKMRQAK